MFTWTRVNTSQAAGWGVPCPQGAPKFQDGGVRNSCLSVYSVIAMLSKCNPAKDTSIRHEGAGASVVCQSIEELFRIVCHSFRSFAI